MEMNRIDRARMILIGVLAIAFLFCCSSQLYAAQKGDFTYTVINGGAKITGFKGYSAKNVVIPNTLGGVPVTSIGDYAFFICRQLQSVTIPDSVTSIGKSAFCGCYSLKSIRIPEGVTRGSQYFFG